VKQYGAQLVRDHSGGPEVVALAKQLRIALPQEQGQMSRDRERLRQPAWLHGPRDSTPTRRRSRLLRELPQRAERRTLRATAAVLARRSVVTRLRAMVDARRPM